MPFPRVCSVFSRLPHEGITDEHGPKPVTQHGMLPFNGGLQVVSNMIQTGGFTLFLWERDRWKVTLSGLLLIGLHLSFQVESGHQDHLPGLPCAQQEPSPLSHPSCFPGSASAGRSQEQNEENKPEHSEGSPQTSWSASSLKAKWHPSQGGCYKYLKIRNFQII